MAPRTKKPPLPPMTVIMDTREQQPYDFKDIEPASVVVIDTLKTGDYSIVGCEHEICIERKTCADAFSTFGRGRERFERELKRMQSYKYAAVIIEADWHTILRCYPTIKFTPRAFHRSVIAWQQRFGVHFWTCPSRIFAERTTYRILERFWKDKHEREIAQAASTNKAA